MGLSCATGLWPKTASPLDGAWMRVTRRGQRPTWWRHGHDLGFGVGIFAGLRGIGPDWACRAMDYTAIGTVANLAARLCAEVKGRQILVSACVAPVVEKSVQF